MFQKALFSKDFYSLARVDFSELLALALAQEALGALPPPERLRQRFRMLARALEARPCTLLLPSDPRWPALPPGPPLPPLALWLEGRLPPGPALGIVGTRQASAEGLRQARDLARRWVLEGGGPVISGGASGIDGAAHRGALEGGGTTVAVLGSDLLAPFPACHRGLFRAVVSRGGGLLSKLPPGAPSCAKSFLERNAVVAGLVEALVVVEAPLQSGAWSTASFALQYGRRTYTFPFCHPRGGPRKGLRPMPGPEALLADLLPPRAPSPQPSEPALDGPARRFLEALGTRTLGLEELARVAGLDTGTLLKVHLELSLRGLVEDCGLDLVRRRIGRNQE